MVLWLILTIIVSVYTVYCLTRKPELPLSPEQEQIERKVNEWLKKGLEERTPSDTAKS